MPINNTTNKVDSFKKIEWAMKTLDKKQWRTFCATLSYGELVAIKNTTVKVVTRFNNSAIMPRVERMIKRLQYVLEIIEAEMLSRSK